MHHHHSYLVCVLLLLQFAAFSKSQNASCSELPISTIRAIAQDRLVLLQSLSNNSETTAPNPEIQKFLNTIAVESIENYAALAKYYRQLDYVDSLTDEAFKIFAPEERNAIEEKVRALETIQNLKTKINEPVEEDKLISSIIEHISYSLDQNGIENYTMFGQTKTPFSIWEKMCWKNKSFDEVYDIFRMRIIAASPIACYQVAQVLSSSYSLIPNRVKDYIGHPKPETNYQAIHLGLIGPFGKRIEIQILTNEMLSHNSISEYCYWRTKTNCYKKFNEE